MSISSNQRSMALCFKLGWPRHKVEVWHSFAKKRYDLFGIIDILALANDELIGIQSTSADVNQHLAKIRESPFTLPWLATGSRLEIWCWRKLKLKRGGKAVRWKVRIVRVLADGEQDLEYDHQPRPRTD